MDTPMFLQVVCAVIVANAACAAFAVAAIAIIRLEKRGVSQDDFPWWVYGCLLAPVAIGLPGAWILAN